MAQAGRQHAGAAAGENQMRWIEMGWNEVR